MATRRRPKDVGAAHAREVIALSGREMFAGRSNGGLSQALVSGAAGMSRSKYGRIERGLEPEVSVASLCRIGAVLGLEVSLRFYPAGDPVRDAGQLALIERFRRCCHPLLSVATEVPFPRAGDLRAWDALVTGFPSRIRVAVEAETRPADVQALERKLSMKQRDGGADHLVLVLADTRHNRAFLAGPGQSLRTRLPLSRARVLEPLRAGADPGGSGIVLL